MLDEINFVNINTHEIYFCGGYRKVRNCKMRKIQEYNKTLKELGEHNQKINDKVMVLRNKLEETSDMESFEEIEKTIEEAEKDLYDEETLMRKQGALVPLLLEDFTVDDYVENMELQDQDLIYALPGLIKLLLARSDEAKINNYARDYIAASADTSINQIKKQFR